MITRQQLDQLLTFRDGEYLVTSCYLNLDRSKMPAQMLKIRTKDLLQAAVTCSPKTDPSAMRV